MNGLIIALQKSVLKVQTNDGLIYKCEITGALKKSKIKLLVGDKVNFDVLEDNKGYIKEILTRENEFIRPRVANVKYSIVIISAKEPDFSINQLEKLLINAELNRTTPIIIITKVDLLTDEENQNLRTELKYYQDLYPVIFKTEPEMVYQELLSIIGTDLAFLQGQTGAGKSTLLNQIDSNLNIKTNEISKKLNRGKHTTTHSEIIKVKDIFIVDTPGFSSLEVAMITNIDAEELKYYYPDFLELSSECKFKNKCNHINEPNCKVKEIAANDETLTKRLQIYKNFYEQLKNNQNR